MKLITNCNVVEQKLRDISLLLVRLILAYGFFNPALMKAKDVSAIVEWFESIHIPFPMLNAYLATGTELLGVVLLALGLFTRIISIPLIFTMIVAIVFVHWDYGFEAAENGFEIPLYYSIMLLVLSSFGSGKFSVDYLIKRKNKKQL